MLEVFQRSDHNIGFKYLFAVDNLIYIDTESFYILRLDTNRCFILVNYEGKQKGNYSEMFSISLSYHSSRVWKHMDPVHPTS